jgi:hypothetical protein
MIITQVRTSGVGLDELVKGHALSTSLLDSGSGAFGESEGNNIEFGDSEGSFVISHSSNMDNGSLASKD